MKSIIGGATVVLALICSDAIAADLWFFNGRCTDAIVKMGSPYEDMHNIRGTKIQCDSAILTELDNGRKLMQFTQKRGDRITPLGFAGTAYVRNEHQLLMLPIDRIYPRRAMGATPEETFAGAGNAIDGAEGACIFGNADLTKAAELSCVAKVENDKTKIIFRVVFTVSDVTIKRNMPMP